MVTEAELSRQGVHDFQSLKDMGWYIAHLDDALREQFLQSIPEWIWKYEETEDLLGQGKYIPNTLTFAELLADPELCAYVSITEAQRNSFSHLVEQLTGCHSCNFVDKSVFE